MKAQTNKQKYEKIGEKKQTTGIRSLCEGFPSEFTLLQCAYILLIIIQILLDQFVKYLQYSRKLGFDETPDYKWLKKLFTDVIQELGDEDDNVYDWSLLNNGKGWQTVKREKPASRKRIMPPPAPLHNKLQQNPEPSSEAHLKKNQQMFKEFSSRQQSYVNEPGWQDKSNCSNIFKDNWRRIKAFFFCK